MKLLEDYFLRPGLRAELPHRRSGIPRDLLHGLAGVAEDVRQEAHAFSVPVDVTSIAAAFGISLRLRPLKTLLGLSERGRLGTGEAGSIIVDSGLPAWAQRFTAAHELGHHLLHFHPYLAEVTNSLGRIPEDREYWLGGETCDWFALALLLPVTQLSASSGPMSWDLLFDAAQRFDLPVWLVAVWLTRLGWCDSAAALVHASEACGIEVLATSDDHRFPTGRGVSFHHDEELGLTVSLPDRARQLIEDAFMVASNTFVVVG